MVTLNNWDNFKVRGQFFFVDWVHLKVCYTRPFIKELDAAKGILHYFMTAADKRQEKRIL
jgi:hypothetical protein